MSVQVPTSDAGLLVLLRIGGPLSVSEFVDAMEVTASAVRQRLVRLLAQSSIQREVTWHGRGRPRHRYWLTEKGLGLTGSNFIDLAATFWRERCPLSDRELRRETLRRIARVLASGYADQISGGTPAERMESLASLLERLPIPVSVESKGQGAVLTEHARPDQDRHTSAPEGFDSMSCRVLGAPYSRSLVCRLPGGPFSIAASFTTRSPRSVPSLCWSALRVPGWLRGADATYDALGTPDRPNQRARSPEHSAVTSTGSRQLSPVLFPLGAGQHGGVDPACDLGFGLRRQSGLDRFDERRQTLPQAHEPAGRF